MTVHLKLPWEKEVVCGYEGKCHVTEVPLDVTCTKCHSTVFKLPQWERQDLIDRLSAHMEEHGLKTPDPFARSLKTHPPQDFIAEDVPNRVHWKRPGGHAAACGCANAYLFSRALTDVNCPGCKEASAPTLEPRKGRWPVAIASGESCIVQANDGTVWRLVVEFTSVGEDPKLWWQRLPGLPQEDA